MVKNWPPKKELPRELRFGTLDRPKQPAVFFDRDGVLNVDRGYTHRPEDLVMIPGAAAAVRMLNEANYYVIVVTNQSGVARGYFSESAVKQFHIHMQDVLKKENAHIDAFYYCPHHEDGSIKELAVRCNCRKPAPGMLQQAMREWPIDLNRSFLIGDKDHDLAAAAACHVRGIKFDAKIASLVDLVRKQLALHTP